ncbi:MAG: OmpA family protein [Methylococcaceae bacterium]|nr:OmpA family protein [Methylococcaceae bacterium]
MNKNDPFGNYLDEDKTVLKPSPRGRTQASADVAPAIDMPISSINLDEHLNLSAEKNPLFSSALTLFALVTQLRQSLSHQDVPALREQLISEVKKFESKAIALQCPLEQVQTARYALCSLVDEVILNTPWGCNSIWTTESLLVSFHKESWGGEKFFKILKNIINQPEIYFNLLELFYYCLSLGFEGKYKIQERGLSELQEIRENLYHILKGQRGELEGSLSLQWRGVGDKRNLLARYVPLWVIAAVAALIIMLIFLGFLYKVNETSTPIISQTFQIKDDLDKPTVVPVKAAPTRSYVDEFRVFLATEINKKQVTVDGENGKTVVRVIAKNFFGSGGDRIQRKYNGLLKKISKALTTVNEPVLIVGHTDNDPIFTARFPSNWDLSNARAKTVADFINKQNRSTGKSVTYEGRADTQSLVPNDSAANKALNRRIEIIF